MGLNREHVVDRLHSTLEHALDRAPAFLGEDAAPYVSVIRKGLTLLVQLIHERGHAETLKLIEMLQNTPMQKL